jgi:hypothetical protein
MNIFTEYKIVMETTLVSQEHQGYNKQINTRKCECYLMFIYFEQN